MSEQQDASSARVAPEVYITDIILPNQTNNHGTMFGGEVLSLMDKAAGIAAVRFCRLPVVTASTERIDFRTPIHVGEIIEAVARTIHVGQTSLIVRVRITAEHALIGERRICTTGYFTMVAVGDDGRPIRVPRLILEDEHARAEWAIGEEIKQVVNARRGR